MLKVQILGKGLIPRLGVLAPVTEPTPVTQDTIKLIFAHPNLRMNYYNETTGKFHPLTKSNHIKIWKDYSVSRTAKGKKPARNPVVDSNPAITQEEALTDVELKNKQLKHYGEPKNVKDDNRIADVNVKDDKIDTNETLSIDNIIPENAEVVPPVAVPETLDTKEVEETTPTEEVINEPKVDNATNNSGFAPVGKDNKNKNKNKR